MKVIGAGYGRTGTSSMKAALELLGLGPCHHMDELFAHPEQIRLWLDVADGRGAAWDVVLDGYTSSVDFPSQHWYRELAARWPDAKVILTVRDPEAWYRSARDTIYAISRDVPIRWVGPYLPVAGGVTRLATKVIWSGVFGGRFLDKPYALSVYQEHIEAVKAHIPPERLLVYDVKEGWAPLCAFLGVPVPAEPFPRRNDTAEFRRRITILKAVCWTILLFPVLAAVGLAIRFLG